MSSTQIDGDQVQNETLTGDDVLNESLEAVDLNLSDVAEGIAADPTAAATILGLVNFGKDYDRDTTTGLTSISGGSFTTYATLTFNVSDTSGVNEYRLYTDFLWGYNATSNDGRFRFMLDGSQVDDEVRIEPKDVGNDQRIQNNIIAYVNNLSSGNHTLQLQARPSTASKTVRLYRATTEVWRTE